VRTGILGQQSGEQITGTILLFTVSEAALKDESQGAQAIQVNSDVLFCDGNCTRYIVVVRLCK
jgi:hypothetical protein